MEPCVDNSNCAAFNSGEFGNHGWRVAFQTQGSRNPRFYKLQIFLLIFSHIFIICLFPDIVLFHFKSTYSHRSEGTGPVLSMVPIKALLSSPEPDDPQDAEAVNELFETTRKTRTFKRLCWEVVMENVVLKSWQLKDGT